MLHVAFGQKFPRVQFGLHKWTDFKAV